MARVCLPFYDKKFLGKRDSFFEMRFLFPLVCLLHLRLMHFGLIPVSSHLSLVLLSPSQGTTFLFSSVVTGLCFCTFGRIVRIKRPTKHKTILFLRYINSAMAVQSFA